MSFLLGSIDWSWLAGAVAAMAAVVGLWFKARRDAQRDMRLKAHEEQAAALERANEAEARSMDDLHGISLADKRQRVRELKRPRG